MAFACLQCAKKDSNLKIAQHVRRECKTVSMLTSKDKISPVPSFYFGLQAPCPGVGVLGLLDWFLKCEWQEK
jgi:hypothetical protein